ncbi:MAG TPA: hypothetical protein VF665_03190 [Longimicrobium sp.]
MHIIVAAWIAIVVFSLNPLEGGAPACSFYDGRNARPLSTGLLRSAAPR